METGGGREGGREKLKIKITDFGSKPQARAVTV